MTIYKPKAITVQAHRWEKNGDHPQDKSRLITPDKDSTTQFAPFMSEGEVVRYYRHPDDSGERDCGDCGNVMDDHGWIDQGAFGRIVCPGDMVVSLDVPSVNATAYFPLPADVFAATYEPVDGEVA